MSTSQLPRHSRAGVDAAQPARDNASVHPELCRMSLPLRSLPILQNWDCHSCSDCCRIEAAVTDEEKDASKGWTSPAIGKLRQARGSRAGLGPVRRLGAETSPRRQLCVFDGRQSLPAARALRRPAKPFVCRLFPFLLIPAGDHWRVGMHYSCPSAAENKGRPLRSATPSCAAWYRYSKCMWADRARARRRLFCKRASRFPGRTCCT